MRQTAAIRPLGDHDVSCVDELVSIALGRPGRPQLPPALLPVREVSFVAEHEGRVVGFAAARGYGAVAYVGPMAVDPLFRRQGIASELLRTLIASLADRDRTTLLLDATDAGAPLYERFGFTVLDRTDVYERALRSQPLRSTTGIDSGRLLRAVEIDRRITGCDRGAALRRFASDANAWLAVRERGFVLFHGRVVGPWLAESEIYRARAIRSGHQRSAGSGNGFRAALERSGAGYRARRGFSRRISHAAAADFRSRQPRHG